MSPRFGPRQRLACILTDMPLDPDEMYPGGLCDRCMMCVRDCTGDAISAEESVKLTVAGRELEWGKIDEPRCGTYFSGGSEEHNPFMITEEDREGFQRDPREAPPHAYKVPPTYVYGRGLEGGRGCIRACMVHLEEQGKLTNTFTQPFRRRPQWRIPWPREDT
jgi:ferredoxin